jgi:hypothetical protein
MTELIRDLPKPHKVNQVVIDTTVNWANSEAAGTEKVVDIALPGLLESNTKYLVTITNPSTETALTVKLQNKETFGTSEKYAEVGSHTVAVNTPDGKSFVTEGWLMAEGGRITLSNDTAIGLAGAFTAEIRIRKL